MKTINDIAIWICQTKFALVTFLLNKFFVAQAVFELIGIILM